jgi:hypothetical protein
MMALMCNSKPGLDLSIWVNEEFPAFGTTLVPHCSVAGVEAEKAECLKEMNPSPRCGLGNIRFVVDADFSTPIAL